MIYSVWNAAHKRYDYYRSDSPAPHTPEPDHLQGVGEMGATPDEAAWPLPSDALFVGSGTDPQGTIASKESAGGGLNMLKAAGLGLAAWGLYKIFRK